MVVIITNKMDITTDYVVRHFNDWGVNFIRLNTEDFYEKSPAFSFGYEYDNGEFFDNLLKESSNITSIYFRRPGKVELDVEDWRFKMYCENEWFAFLESFYQIPEGKWINHPNKIRRAESKALQLKIAKELNFSIPSTLITNNYEKIIRFFNTVEEVVVKPLGSSIIPDSPTDRVVYTSEVKREHISKSGVEMCPAIYQEKINKVCDVRVNVVGDTVFSVGIDSQKKEETSTDWRRGENINLKHYKLELPKKVEEKCKKIVSRLGLYFGALDFALDDNGIFYFLEINPNGQWAWVEERVGLPISKKIAEGLI